MLALTLHQTIEQHRQHIENIELVLEKNLTITEQQNTLIEMLITKVAELEQEKAK